MPTRRGFLVQLGALAASLPAARCSAATRPVHDVLDYGASGDGVRDDSAAFQSAMDAAAIDRGTVLARRSPGPYLVGGIALRSGTRLELAAGAVLKAPAGLARNGVVIRIEDVHDVEIVGGIIDGSRALQEEGEHRHGIRVRGSDGVALRGVTVRECAGDGFYIGSSARQPYSSRVLLEGCAALRNRRQGISLISGIDVQILRTRVTDTGGTAPEAGLDIEPNEAGERLERIRIVDLHTARNAGGGILIALRRLTAASSAVDIEIVRHRSVDDVMGMRTAGMPNAVPGSIVISDPVYVRPALHGFLARNWSARAPAIRLIRPVVIDANQSRHHSERYGSAIAVYKSGDDPALPAVIGNVHIEAPEVRDSRGEDGVSWAFYLRNDVDPAGMARVTLDRPRTIGLPRERTLRRAQGVRLRETGPPDP